MQCPNCAEAELIPVRVIRKSDGAPVTDADYCPACGVLQESSG